MPRKKVQRAPNNVEVRVAFQRAAAAGGLSSKTTTGILRAVEKFSQAFPDLALIEAEAEDAQTYRDLLKRAKNPKSGRNLAPTTQIKELAYLRDFYAHLAGVDGYPEARLKSLARSFAPERSTRMDARTWEAAREVPSLDWVLRLLESIPADSEFGLRDRAALALAAMTGSRIGALTTLTLGSVDLTNLVVRQRPRDGVETKFGKNIDSTIFVFDEVLLHAVRDWLDHCKSAGKTDKAPFFPKARVVHVENTRRLGAIELMDHAPASKNAVNVMLKKRAADAGLPAFTVHALRYLAIDLAKRACLTPMEHAAVSKSFGHVHVRTTEDYIGRMKATDQLDILGRIDFSVQASEPMTQSKIKAMPEAELRAYALKLLARNVTARP